MRVSEFRSSLESFAQRHWGGGLLIVAACLYLFLPLLSFDTNNVDEGAARSLLLNWAIADRVINPIVILGMPDFRALLFAPLAIYWPGSMVAAKVLGTIVFLFGVLWCFRWTRARFNEETAMLAMGLLLIAPLSLTQLDSLSAGPFVLAGMALLWRIEDAYAASDRIVGGLFYFRLLIISFLATLHPAGLGYPLALLWRWYKNPTNNKKQRMQVMGGIVACLALVGVLHAGWIDMHWGMNPLMSLGAMVSNPELDETGDWSLGMLPLFALVGIALGYWRQWRDDTAGLGWLIAILLGALSADGTWAFLALAMILIYGLGGLITLHSKLPIRGFIGQRGLVFLLLFGLSTVYMQDDKSIYDLRSANVMTSRDRLLRVLAAEVDEHKVRTVTASQWPGQTMLACRCEVLPLPPAADSDVAFEKSLKGLQYIVFNPGDPAMKPLAQRVAMANSALKTMAMEDRAVLLEVAQPPTK